MRKRLKKNKLYFKMVRQMIKADQAVLFSFTKQANGLEQYEVMAKNLTLEGVWIRVNQLYFNLKKEESIINEARSIIQHGQK